MIQTNPATGGRLQTIKCITKTKKIKMESNGNLPGYSGGTGGNVSNHVKEHIMNRILVLGSLY